MIHNCEIVTLRLKIRNTNGKKKWGKKRINTHWRNMMGLCRVVETTEHIANLKNCGASPGLIRVMEEQLVIYEREAMTINDRYYNSLDSTTTGFEGGKDTARIVELMQDERIGGNHD